MSSLLALSSRAFRSRPTSLLTLASFLHTSAVCLRQGRTKVRKLRKVNEVKEAKFRYGPGGILPPVMPLSPLAKTFHPTGAFLEEEEALTRSIDVASRDDRPDECLRDPYGGEAPTCILCPKRYAVSIRPDYKNPKLLAQFVSPHTGLVYKKHITGLCEFMQNEVEMEVKRAQSLGFLATKMKELHYLKDPALFNPSRPFKKNPY